MNSYALDYTVLSETINNKLAPVFAIQWAWHVRGDRFAADGTPIRLPDPRHVMSMVTEIESLAEDTGYDLEAETVPWLVVPVGPEEDRPITHYELLERMSSFAMVEILEADLAHERALEAKDALAVRMPANQGTRLTGNVDEDVQRFIRGAEFISLWYFPKSQYRAWCKHKCGDGRPYAAYIRDLDAIAAVAQANGVPVRRVRARVRKLLEVLKKLGLKNDASGRAAAIGFLATTGE